MIFEFDARIFVGLSHISSMIVSVVLVVIVIHSIAVEAYVLCTISLITPPQTRCTGR